MATAIVSSKGQLVIPKSIRDALGIKKRQKVLFTLLKNRAVIEPLPENPIEEFCGIFEEGSSLTAALLNERKEDNRREEKNRP